MKYDNDYLKDLYDNNDLDEFLNSINVDNVVCPRTKAIIGALKRSMNMLRLEFNPLQLENHPKNQNTQG